MKTHPLRSYYTSAGSANLNLVKAEVHWYNPTSFSAYTGEDPRWEYKAHTSYFDDGDYSHINTGEELADDDLGILLTYDALTAWSGFSG